MKHLPCLDNTSNATASQQGFSLLELLIAMSILVILASVAVPTYTDYQIRARATEFTMAVRPFKASMDEWALLHSSANAWPVSGDDIGWSDFVGDHVSEVRYRRSSDPQIAAIVVSGDVDGNEIVMLLQGALETGRVRWRCTAQQASLKYLPRSCDADVAAGLL